jgi:hypothetical protein
MCCLHLAAGTGEQGIYIAANPEWLSSYEKSIEKLRELRDLRGSNQAERIARFNCYSAKDGCIIFEMIKKPA